MCPIMSLAATILFKETKSFGTWVQTWAMNFPMAICYQMFYCGPLVRLIFRAIFVRKNADATRLIIGHIIAIIIMEIASVITIGRSCGVTMQKANL